MSNGSRISDQTVNWSDKKQQDLSAKDSNKLNEKDYQSAVNKLWKEQNKLYSSLNELYETNPTCELGTIINSMEMVATEMKKL